MMDAWQASVAQIIALGGPVVVVLGVIAVLVLSVMFYKLWQFFAAGVGRHRALTSAVEAFEQGDASTAQTALSQSRHYLAPVMRLAIETPHDTARLEAEAEARFAALERGFRLLDSVAQLAPLLGLFGTVIGMISAFQALQDAGSQVDPSMLAGGIWVALLTTAAGLAVAMPTALVLSWFEARMDGERVFAARVLAILSASRQGG